jgi:transcriptional regulator with XRE-family HTH domain
MHDIPDYLQVMVSRRRAGLGWLIRENRKELGLTQSQAARLAGLEASRLGRIERGTGRLFAEELVPLASALQVDPSELLAALDHKMAAPRTKSTPPPLSIVREAQAVVDLARPHQESMVLLRIGGRSALVKITLAQWFVDPDSATDQ